MTQNILGLIELKFVKKNATFFLQGFFSVCTNHRFAEDCILLGNVYLGTAYYFQGI